MARKLNKLDRMGVSEAALTEESLEEVIDGVREGLTALETFEEQREACGEAMNEAASHHEERDWESRDSSLDEAMGAIEEMSSALDDIEVHTDVISLPPRGAWRPCASWSMRCGREHLEQLI